MMMNQVLVIFAGVNGAFWLAASAWLVHSSSSFSAKEMSSLAIACCFALLHSLLLLQLGFVDKKQTPKLLRLAGCSLILGIFLFCFIILFKVVWPDSIIARLSPLTPIGGLALISAWLMIALQGFYKK
ncbi:DUF423 domain-containing protein [Thalassotalea mangrovi]|uniref:DUF423 domain-containing protein n=1 Tax=Thalassotalea mangrovi TaxID=2572245 RepID=A0A4U1B349_9GAMM|nr:DUF423 domain-containing protein [Thalassotalea mangrovi]TKB43516.1 DUF423 domain-containing protein [Thalassotalea mangrovi]